jgi:5-methylcytosine-specific restriction protein A
MSPSRRLRSVCAEPGCPELTDTVRCPNHASAKTREYNANRPNAAERGYDGRWQATRRRCLLAHPTCEWSGCNQPATDVDHLDGLGPLGPLGHDQANLQALCHPHHTRLTNRYNGGYGNPKRPRPESSTGEAQGAGV